MAATPAPALALEFQSLLESHLALYPQHLPGRKFH